jgi:hypothetical protein
MTMFWRPPFYSKYAQAVAPTHSHLRYDALPVELSCREQGGGEEGYTSVISWCPLLKLLLWNTPG